MHDVRHGVAGMGLCKQRMAQRCPCRRVRRRLESQPVVLLGPLRPCQADLNQHPSLAIEANHGPGANRPVVRTSPRAAIPTQFPLSRTNPESHRCGARQQQNRHPKAPTPVWHGPGPRQRQEAGQPGQPQHPCQKRRTPHRVTNRWGAGHEQRSMGGTGRRADRSDAGIRRV